jgi:DMSO/TMAO reductase YedYZ heme-binding membrane subunit
MLMWYLARGAGITAFAALSVATGVGAFSARRGGRPSAAQFERRVIWQYVHRAAALTGVAMLVLHIATLLADSYAHVGWVGALVPFASAYRPLAVTLGLLSMYCLVAVTVTGILRSRFAVSERASRWWRRIHLLAYAAWGMSALHFLTSGSDAGTWWARLVLLSGCAIVLAGAAVRLVDGPSSRTSAPTGRLTPSGLPPQRFATPSLPTPRGSTPSRVSADPRLPADHRVPTQTGAHR